MALVLWAAAALALSTGLEEPDPLQVQRGGMLFGSHCSVCHGVNLEARPGMVDLRRFQGTGDDLAKTVSNGRGQMPAFSGVFTRIELEAIYAYVRSRREQQAAE